MKHSRVVKCRFCDWKTPLFAKKKNKTTGPDVAFRKLEDHVSVCHASEWDGIQTSFEEGG